LAQGCCETRRSLKVTIDIANDKDWKQRLEEQLQAGQSVELKSLRTQPNMNFCLEVAQKYKMDLLVGPRDIISFSRLP
jgi:hypothetical protein